jgi:hypothetical protein
MVVDDWTWQLGRRAGGSVDGKPPIVRSTSAKFRLDRRRSVQRPGAASVTAFSESRVFRPVLIQPRRKAAEHA